MSEAEKRSSGQLINYVGRKTQEQKLQRKNGMNCQCLGKQTNTLKTEHIHLVLYLYIHIKQLVTLLAVLNAGLKE